MRWRRTTAAAATLILGLASRAEGGDTAKKPANAGLRDSTVTDDALEVSLPVSTDLSLTVGLPEHFWICTTPHTDRPASLDGDGVNLSYIKRAEEGSSSSILYLGVIPLPAVATAEKPGDRVDRAAAAFVSRIADDYAHFDYAIQTPAEKLKLERTTVKLDGRPVPCLRSPRYTLKPTGGFNRPNLLFTGEFLLLPLAGTDSIAYLAMDLVRKGITLDRVLDHLSLGKTAAVNRKGRPVKLIEESSAPGHVYIVRSVVYASPAGFVPNYPACSGADGVYAEDRLDDAGTITAAYRVMKRDPVAAGAFEEEGELQKKTLGIDAAVRAKKVDLGTAGASALVYAYATKFEGKTPCAAVTAFFRLEDQCWAFTWYSLGGAATAASDALAFEQLLRGMQASVR